MNEIIHNKKGKQWITRHNTISMLRSLFMGKVWKWNGYEIVIRQTVDDLWVFGCLAIKEDTTKNTKEEVILPVDMDLNQFMKIMSNENILFEQLPNKG